jgi:hypothetical protein
MKHHLLCLSLILALPGCATLFPESGGGPRSITGPSDQEPATEMSAPSGTTALGARAVRAEVLDTTTAEEKAAALAAPAASGERALGRVVVALGPPAEQGLWLRTALVSEVVQGRVETAAGKSLTLELRPGTGGALLSLAAFQALGLSLTDLPQVSVFAP